jgi:L-threonylcarbamoyladenylate synthase
MRMSVAKTKTEMLTADEAGIGRAAQLLRDGQLVAFPTETVYGLGADAKDDRAVAEIFAAKGRPSFNPLIVHVSDRAQAETLVSFNDTADRLARAFWPGPLTLVLPLREDAGISRLATCGLDTLAIRIPGHDLAQRLLARAGCPIAAPSANRSGQISPTKASHVASGLGGRIAAILDGGDAKVGLESTIIDCTGPVARILRPGGLPLEALVGAVDAIEMENVTDDTAPSAPGQMTSHYAPDAKVRLGAADKSPGELLLGFGDVQGADMNLSPAGDLTEAAANLFAYLHELDGKGETIAVSSIPDRGLGRAINDRLRRAAAPRDR